MSKAIQIVKGTKLFSERESDAEQVLGNGRPEGRRLDDQGQMTWQEIADVLSEASGEKICAQTVINDHNRGMMKIMKALLADPSAHEIFAHLGIDDNKLVDQLAEVDF